MCGRRGRCARGRGQRRGRKERGTWAPRLWREKTREMMMVVPVTPPLESPGSPHSPSPRFLILDLISPSLECGIFAGRIRTIRNPLPPPFSDSHKRRATHRSPISSFYPSRNHEHPAIPQRPSQTHIKPPPLVRHHRDAPRIHIPAVAAPRRPPRRHLRQTTRLPGQLGGGGRRYRL